MNKFVFLSTIFVIAGFFLPMNSFAQLGDSPFERNFGDVKYLDAYFGISDEKMEVENGDQNVPFTVVFANVGSQDITGISGQLAMPFGFSSADGAGSLIYADSSSNSLAGNTFELTFFVNIEENVSIGQYPGSVKVDYSRLRESGVRTAFFEFDFKVTGDSIINMRALEPFLTSLQENKVLIEISNDGTAPVSGVDIELVNTQGTISSTSQSVTNVENVVVLDSNWDVGHINPGTSKYLEVNVYVPESLKGDTLRAPMDITYFDSHGQRHKISRIVDFYVKGFIDNTIYNVGVIDLSGKQTVVGEIINEGNEDALFGFVTLEPKGDSNIKKQTQFIDEIETDSPVPFNIPIEFEGDPQYGEHDIKVTVRYKDALRDEKFLSYETTIYLEDNSTEEESSFDTSQLALLGLVIGIVVVGFTIRKRRQSQKQD